MRYPLYTEAEIEIMRRHYPSGGPEECFPLMDRSLESISRQAKIQKIIYDKPQPIITDKMIIDEWLTGGNASVVSRNLGVSNSKVSRVVKEYRETDPGPVENICVGLPPMGWRPNI